MYGEGNRKPLLVATECLLGDKASLKTVVIILQLCEWKMELNI